MPTDKKISLDNIKLSELENLSKKQLLKHIDTLQTKKKIYEPSCTDTQCAVIHEHQVHQLELEMQNRELKEAQQQLEETRDKYADLYDFAPVNYITFDNKGLINNINLTGASMLEDVRAHIIGQPFSKWLDKENLKLFNKHLRTTLESDLKVVDELKLKNASGMLVEVRIESIRSKFLPAHNYLCRSVLLDITDYNRIKEELILQARQLKLITDTLPVLIGYIDLNEQHLFANKTYVDAFGFSAGEVIGKSASNIWGERNYKSVNKHLKIALAGQVIKFDMELPIGDKQKKYFHTTLIPDSDGNGLHYGVIVLIGDITDRLAIEAIDRKRLLDIAHFSRLSTMGEMASEIAHELNQPLAAISIYGDACRRMILSGKGDQELIMQSLSDISHQAERAGAVIHRIREFTSKKEVLRNKINLNELVEAALKLLAVEIRDHNVKLSLNLEEDMPSTLVDRILIEQVIFNLARNALEAMDDIDEELRVLKIETMACKTGELEVRIDDSGPGISSEKLKQIFEPFFTTKSDGMGMGLTISCSIIEAHHGRLWATSNQHGGTTFNFTLPLKNEEDDYAE